MSRCLLFLLFIGSILPAKGQIYYDRGRQISGQDSIAFANPNSLNINPAYLGHASRKYNTFQVLQLGFNAHSDFLNRNELNDATFSNDSVPTDLKERWSMLSGGQPFDLSTDITAIWISASLSGPKLGGLSFTIGDYVTGNLLLDSTMLELFLLGRGATWVSDAPDGSVVPIPANGTKDRLFYQHTRQLRAGYGRKVLSAEKFTLYAGAQATYVLGIGYLNVGQENGQIIGTSTFSDAYNLDYGELNKDYKAISQRLLSTAGNGLTYGAGLSLDLAGNWNFAVAVQDIGSIRWTGKVAEANTDSVLINPSVGNGIETFGFAKESALLYDAFRFGEGEQFTVMSPATVRLNALWRAKPSLTLSLDVLTPLNPDLPGSMPGPNVIAGVGYRPFMGLMQITSGILFNPDYGFRWPVGVSGNFGEGNTIISISTNDMFTLWRNRSNPMSSLSIATLQQRF